MRFRGRCFVLDGLEIQFRRHGGGYRLVAQFSRMKSNWGVRSWESIGKPAYFGRSEWGKLTIYM